MLEKVFKCVTLENSSVTANFIKYKKAIDNTFPVLSVAISPKTYTKEDLKPMPKDLESDILSNLFFKVDKWCGKESELFLLEFNADNEIYGATARFRSNVVICNKATRKLAKKMSDKKKIIVSEKMQDNQMLLLVVPEDRFSYGAILVKDKENKNYLLDIVNPDLIKAIIIQEA